MMSQTEKIVIAVLVTAIIIGGGSYLIQAQNSAPSSTANPGQTTTQNPSPIPSPTPAPTPAPVSNPTPTTTTVSYLVPKDQTSYEKAVLARFNGDPATTKDPASLPFIAKQLTIPYTTNTITIMKAAINAAAGVFSTGGGPDHAEVAYLKVVGNTKTAYVLLNIDVNGWAGVSLVIMRIHPPVEKTLLAQPGITKVVFDVAPGDKMSDVQAGQ